MDTRSFTVVDNIGIRMRWAFAALVVTLISPPLMAQPFSWQRVVECGPDQWWDGYSGFEFQGELVLLGPTGYASTDGLIFEETFKPPIADPHTLIPPYHGSVVFNNQIWVLGGGGRDEVPYEPFVWYSNDARSWAQPEGQEPPWGPRGGPAAVVFAGAMWLLGGSYYPGTDKQSVETVYYNDIWRSADGIQWEQVVESAPWVGRAFHVVVVLGDQMLLLAGETQTDFLRDVWSSKDGVEWTQLLAEAPWALREFPETVVFQDKLWLLGGNLEGLGLTTDIWTTADGTNWQLETAEAPWGPRHDFVAVVFNDELLVIGGKWPEGVGDAFIYDDIWVLTDAPPVVAPLDWQSADQDQDNQISLSELLRVIQFYNSMRGPYPGFHCNCDSEDGFDPRYGVRTCAPHTSDYNPQDWQISLGELLRLIQFFNSSGYHACPDTASEDGFCVGAG